MILLRDTFWRARSDITRHCQRNYLHVLEADVQLTLCDAASLTYGGGGR
jgi:hypothetical protein